MKHIEFRWGEMPKSINHLYRPHGGRMVPTTQGKAYKNAFVAGRGGVSAHALMSFEADPEAPYKLELWFFFAEERLLNPKYGQDRRTKYRYKTLDVSNLIKAAEDAISALVGINDRNHFTVIAHKRVADDGEEGMVARLSPLDLEDDPHALD